MLNFLSVHFISTFLLLAGTYFLFLGLKGLIYKKTDRLGGITGYGLFFILLRKISKEKVARGNDAIKLGTFYIILTFLLYILAIYQYTIGK